MRESLKVAIINTPAGKMEFQIVNTNIPFLICLQQLDKMGAHYNNLRNILI